MIETEQKLIQVGSSEGFTLSKKDIATLGAKRGDILRIRVERVIKKSTRHEDLLKDYDMFVKMYGQTLKNLADR